MHTLTLLIVLCGICNGYRLWNMLGRQQAAFPRHSSSKLPLKRLFRRGTHESTEEEEKVQVVVPIVRHRMPVSDPYVRRGLDGKRFVFKRPNGQGDVVDQVRTESQGKAHSDPMEYAQTVIDLDSSLTMPEEDGNVCGSASDAESSPSRLGTSRSASSRSPSKSGSVKISRGASNGVKRATSDLTGKIPSKNTGSPDPLIWGSSNFARVASTENPPLRVSPVKITTRMKTLPPTSRTTSKQTDQLKSSTDRISRQASQEVLAASVSKERSPRGSPSFHLLSDESMEPISPRRGKRRALLDSLSNSHATAMEESESFDEIRQTRNDIPRSKSDTNALAPKDLRAKSENLMAVRGFSGGDGFERPYRSTSDTTTDTAARPHTIQTGNPVLES